MEPQLKLPFLSRKKKMLSALEGWCYEGFERKHTFCWAVCKSSTMFTRWETLWRSPWKACEELCLVPFHHLKNTVGFLKPNHKCLSEKTRWAWKYIDFKTEICVMLCKFHEKKFKVRHFRWIGIWHPDLKWKPLENPIIPNFTEFMVGIKCFEKSAH